MAFRHVTARPNAVGILSEAELLQKLAELWVLSAQFDGRPVRNRDHDAVPLLETLMTLLNAAVAIVMAVYMTTGVT